MRFSFRSARTALVPAILVALLPACGVDDPVVTTGDEAALTSFACTSTQVTPDRPAVYFGPFDPAAEEALCLLDTAQSEVIVGHYNIRSPEFLDKLVELKDRGVDVRVAVDLANAGHEWNTGDDFLEQHGIPIVRTKPSGAGAIMHLKTTVVDQRWVMTGSFNWNMTASLANDENMIVFDEPALAAKFRDEVLEVRGEKPRTIGGGAVSSTVRVHFAPEERLDKIIAKEIDAARVSVDVAMFTLTNATVVDALVRAENRGVAVRVVTEGKQSGSTNADERVRQAGGEVVEGRNRVGAFSAMHQKYSVIDGAVVLTGATNWTNAGTRTNEEDLLVLKSTDLAARYTANFLDLLHVYAGIDTLTPPSPEAGVLFAAVQPGTNWGDRVVVTGDDPKLGSWNPRAGLELRTSDDLFPTWTGRVHLAPGQALEYKFVTLRTSGHVDWEPGPNRRLNLPASGRGTVITGPFGDTSKSWTPLDAPEPGGGGGPEE